MRSQGPGRRVALAPHFVWPLQELWCYCGVMTVCDEDRERRIRASKDCALSEWVGPMERRIEFLVGYDHRSFGCGHGQHGMSIRFVLRGPAGAVTWTICAMNWVPGNVDTIKEVKSQSSLSVVPVRHPQLGDAMGVAVDLHASSPRYEGQDGSPAECTYVDGVCYFDTSFLAGSDLVPEFLEHGPHAVWAHLARWYSSQFGGSDA